MEWFVAGTVAAIAFGLNNLLAKHLMQKDSALTYTAVYSTLGLLLITPITLGFARLEISTIALIAAITSGFVNIIAFYFYNDSIKIGEISTVIPLTRLTPVFTGIFGFFLLGETFGWLNGLGIFIVTAGAYLVLLEEMNIIKPLERIIHDKAEKLAVASSVVYGLAAIVDRFGTQQIDPLLYTWLIYATMTVGLLTFLKIKHDKFSHIKNAFEGQEHYYLISAIFSVTGSISIFYAFSKAAAFKVVPLLQFQVLIGVLGGIILFNERDLTRKLAGSIILVGGVVLVAVEPSSFIELINQTR